MRATTEVEEMAGIQGNGMIVPERLERGNYTRWSIITKTRLKRINAWGAIEDSKDPNLNWTALEAIQCSCGNEALALISKIESAKTAWNLLRAEFSQISGASRDDGEDIRVKPLLPRDTFHWLAGKGKWEEASKLIDRDLRKIYDHDDMDRMPLHVCLINRKEKLALKLIGKMSVKSLEETDADGFTALARVADLGLDIDLAESLVNKNPSLVGIKTNEDLIPVMLASARGHRDLTYYLCKVTTEETLIQDSSHVGASIVTIVFVNCLRKQIFDVALHLLETYPDISLTYEYPIFQLAGMSSAFLRGSGTQLLDASTSESIQVDCESLQKHKKSSSASLMKAILQILPGKRGVRDQELTPNLTSPILKNLTEKIKNFDEPAFREARVYESVLESVKNGNLEFLKLMIEAMPQLVSVTDDLKRGILSNAFLYRQEKVVEFMLEHYVVGPWLKASHTDVWDNNMLHLAGMCQRDMKSNGLLEMQKAVKWFEEVERVVDPQCKEALNKSGKNPRQLFSAEHEKPMKEVEKWSKKSSRTFSAIAILIYTIMVAVVFCGNDPYLVQAANLYQMSGLISLVSSCFSLLTFIRIHTSHYTETDFYIILPRRFILALSTLYLSVITMVITACTAVPLILGGHLQITYLAIILVSLLVVLFAPLQFELFVEILTFTYKSEVFSYEDSEVKYYYNRLATTNPNSAAFRQEDSVTQNFRIQESMKLKRTAK